MLYYSGKVYRLRPEDWFVFGSNTQGRHGLGAALDAAKRFGAIRGQARGPQGQSYAIVTKDLTKSTHPSIEAGDITEEIRKLYKFASDRPDSLFYVAYSGTRTNLNGYTPAEMARMFAANPQIPHNMVFELTFATLVQGWLPEKYKSILEPAEM